MATEPEPRQPKPSRPVRLARRVAEPVSAPRKRRTALLAAAAGCAAGAPFLAPLGALGAALIVVAIANEK